MRIWESPLGRFEVEENEYGIFRIHDHAPADGETLKFELVGDDLAQSLTEHLHGRPASLRLDLSAVTSSIGQLTLAKLLEIPYGEVRSYSWVAKEINHPAAVRPVANAVAGNPIPVLIPCHRVTRSDGHIGDYSAGGADMKRRLLAFEGVDIDLVENYAQRHIRFLADKETNQYHLTSCRLAPAPGAAVLQELHNLDQAADAHYEPCRRCKPV